MCIYTQEAENMGQWFEISRVFHLPTCLTDEDILEKTKMMPEGNKKKKKTTHSNVTQALTRSSNILVYRIPRLELERIRTNTREILAGKFQTSAAGVGFYSTLSEEGPSSKSSNSDQEKIANSEQRPFDGETSGLLLHSIFFFFLQSSNG